MRNQCRAQDEIRRAASLDVVFARRNCAAFVCRMTIAFVLLMHQGCAGPSRPSEQIASGYLAIGQGQPDVAVATADRLLSAAPSAPAAAEAWCLRGRAFEAKADTAGRNRQTDQARQFLITAGDAYTRAIASQPTRDIEALSRAGLANVAFFLDDYPTALREWPAAIPLTDDYDARAWMLLRVGICQQRLGWFELADETFDQVVRRHGADAKGVPAQRAIDCRGARGFFVQVATFTSQAAAESEVATLKRQGVVAFRTAEATSRQFVRIGPIPTYPAARTLQARMAGRYADALIVP